MTQTSVADENLKILFLETTFYGIVFICPSKKNCLFNFFC